MSTVVPAQSKSEIAYEWVKQRITSQEFTPGYRLVLGTIAAELDMSVVPVREAIRQLEAEGMVTFTRNVGAHVSMVNIGEYRESMETLSFLEGAATALSAPHLTVEDIREARAINAEMQAGLAHLNPTEFTVKNQKFHAALYKRCENARLLDLVEGEWARLSYLRDSSFTRIPRRAIESVQEHEHILKLIEASAPIQQIEDAARQHRTATLVAYLDKEKELTLQGEHND